VCLSFFDEKNKHPGWFSNKTERIYWEQWFINLHVISPKGQGKSRGSKAPTNTKGIFMAPS
jgi:3-methyladenine DNA glycosylase AlkD